MGGSSEDENLLFIHCKPKDNSSELRSFLKSVTLPFALSFIQFVKHYNSKQSSPFSLPLKPFKMPRLRQITCQVEWPDTGLKFEEYGTVYGDGLVETFIAVPDKPQPFSIHLTSKGYIAEGLAMLVYMDGEYQCNRNRLHLKPPEKAQARDRTDVDFRLRQKEKTIGGGTFIGRDWRFDSHNIG
jgi:hypothetical protein